MHKIVRVWNKREGTVMKKRQGHRPMLYITQPEFNSTKPSMQSTYNTIKTKQKSENVNVIKRSSKALQKKQDLKNKQEEKSDHVVVPNEISEKVNEKEVNFEIKNEEINSKVKNKEEDKDIEEEMHQNVPNKFKELSIEEQIDNLIKSPPGIPPVKCQIETGDESFFGVIIERNDDTIKLRQFKKPLYVTVNLDEIKTIKRRSF